MNIVKIGISAVILLIGMSISGAVVLDGDVAGGVITIQNGTETIEMHLNECSNKSPRHWGYTYTVDANGTETVREFNRLAMADMMAEMDINKSHSKVYSRMIDANGTETVREFNRSEMMFGMDVNDTEAKVHTHRIDHSNATNMIEASHNTSDDGQNTSKKFRFVDRLWTTFRGLW